MQPIRKLANINVQFQNGLAAAERVFSIFDNNDIITEHKNPKILNKFNNSIIFNNVSFSYSNNEKMTLKNLNTEISKGQTTAIVGKSGSGKSTFADLISRFYDVGNGEILIDQKNIKDYSLESLRKFIGIVTQNIILFDDSIRNNILNGNIVATNEQINSAIKSANLVELISKLPNGIETIIGENGVQLSGGEKQRLSIARALIKNPDILILDEATASLDTTSESNVHGAIEKLLRNRTVIIIAHRLSTIVNADKIIIFEDGKIIEEGNHERLIKESKVYKELYNLKFNE
jgi:subfamily B ATP-binding cassette protein MsbA